MNDENYLAPAEKQKVELQKEIDGYVHRGFRIIEQDATSARLICNRFRYLGIKKFALGLVFNAGVFGWAAWRRLRHKDHEAFRGARETFHDTLIKDVNILVSLWEGKVHVSGEAFID